MRFDSIAHFRSRLFSFFLFVDIAATTTTAFEQLCINFCNEKLQQQFNKTTFKREEGLYESEGIEFKRIHYHDNQDVLDLIEKKRPAGLLVLLDDECKVPRGSWNGWLSKCKKAHTAHPRFVMKLTDKECFSPVVISYAERTFLAQ